MSISAGGIIAAAAAAAVMRRRMLVRLGWVWLGLGLLCVLGRRFWLRVITTATCRRWNDWMILRSYCRIRRNGSCCWMLHQRCFGRRCRPDEMIQHLCSLLGSTSSFIIFINAGHDFGSRQIDGRHPINRGGGRRESNVLRRVSFGGLWCV